MALGKGLGSLIPQNKEAVLPSKKTPSKPNFAVKDQETKSEDKIWHIPISEITPNEEQPRKNFSYSDLEELVSSIKQHGILQPVTVMEKRGGGYELIAGERRLRAAEIAEFATVPAIVRKVGDNKEKLELALIENIQRQNLDPIEEAFAYRRLMDEFGLTQQEVADRVGKKRPTVANTVRLLDLPEEIQQGLVDGKISTGKARALLSLKSQAEQWNMYQSMVGQKMSVRDVERAVSERPAKSRKGSIRRDPNLLSQEEEIENVLKTKVRITQKGEQGTIVIYYYSKEELKDLRDKLSQE